MQVCVKCNSVLPEADFYRDRAGVLSRRCRACVIAAARQWAKLHPEEHRANARESKRRAYAANPHKYRLASRQRYYADVDRTRAMNREAKKRRYWANRENEL